MILIFGYGLVYLTGILTGALFLLSFLGCCCHVNSRICKSRIIMKIMEHHRILVYLALISFLVHASLAVLSRLGIII